MRLGLGRRRRVSAAALEGAAAAAAAVRCRAARAAARLTRACLQRCQSLGGWAVWAPPRPPRRRPPPPPRPRRPKSCRACFWGGGASARRRGAARAGGARRRRVGGGADGSASSLCALSVGGSEARARGWCVGLCLCGLGRAGGAASGRREGAAGERGCRNRGQQGQRTRARVARRRGLVASRVVCFQYVEVTRLGMLSRKLWSSERKRGSVSLELSEVSEEDEPSCSLSPLSPLCLLTSRSPRHPWSRPLSPHTSPSIMAPKGQYSRTPKRAQPAPLAFPPPARVR